MDDQNHDFCKDWLVSLTCEERMVPDALILHSQWIDHQDLSLWRALLGAKASTPDWNTVTGDFLGRRIAFAHVFGPSMVAATMYPWAMRGSGLFIHTGYANRLRRDTCPGSILIAESAYAESVTESAVFHAAPELVDQAVYFCEQSGYPYRVGTVISASALPSAEEGHWRKWEKENLDGVDMETASVFSLASRLGKKSISLLNMAGLAACMASETKQLSDEIMNTDRRIRELSLHLAASQVKQEPTDADG
ncbi:hypothetical protein M3N64_05580 [Sporolactobacillus sp. CPB3-1]|uniref:Nucleoside phosphorylase domain-containing protein n=1 Tax=Sporolactobacillus mangiferae TaxID=2940498 RepID=A0ABT0M969_9BACL|nr:hypothetical protein [Sporolactobacillus mangiferae]MCL1631422.1 hypothetical protein [Sporolactobacillus mangiferae]